MAEVPDHAAPSAEPGTATGGDAPVIAAVVPCYRETAHVLDVIAAMGNEVRHIIIVDDACPDGTGALVRKGSSDPRVEVIVHDTNSGVGGATISGYGRALELGADIVVKLDGDGQMDPAMIPTLVQPIVEGEADYTKGNRFHALQVFGAMPPMRITGNMLLSFLSKMSSGYWDIFDPTNGFTAIHAAIVRALPLKRISKGFFFESDMLFHLGVLGAVVRDVPMKARYGTEKSAISIPRIIPEFLAKHYANTCRRVWYSYFVRGVTFATLQLVLGKALLLFGVAYGGYWWYVSEAANVFASAGTVVLAALPIIIGTQFLIAFVNFDTRAIPRHPIHAVLRRLEDENGAPDTRPDS